MRIIQSVRSFIRTEEFSQFMRFCIVGVIATAINYGIYWLLQIWVNHNIAYTAGYSISLVCNFFLTSRFTFRRRATVGKSLGFGIAHLVNYLLQIALLNIFICLNIDKQLAPIPVYMISVPLNFLMVKFVFKK